MNPRELEIGTIITKASRWGHLIRGKSVEWEGRVEYVNSEFIENFDEEDESDIYEIIATAKTINTYGGFFLPEVAITKSNMKRFVIARKAEPTEEMKPHPLKGAAEYMDEFNL